MGAPLGPKVGYVAICILTCVCKDVQLRVCALCLGRLEPSGYLQLRELGNLFPPFLDLSDQLVVQPIVPASGFVQYSLLEQEFAQQFEWGNQPNCIKWPGQYL